MRTLKFIYPFMHPQGKVSILRSFLAAVFAILLFGIIAFSLLQIFLLAYRFMYWSDLGDHTIAFVGSPEYQDAIGQAALSPEDARLVLDDWLLHRSQEMQESPQESAITRDPSLQNAAQPTSYYHFHAAIVDGCYVFTTRNKSVISLDGYYVDIMSGDVRDVSGVEPGIVPIDQAEHLGYRPPGSRK